MLAEIAAARKTGVGQPQFPDALSPDTVTQGIYARAGLGNAENIDSTKAAESRQYWQNAFKINA